MYILQVTQPKGSTDPVAAANAARRIQGGIRIIRTRRTIISSITSSCRSCLNSSPSWNNALHPQVYKHLSCKSRKLLLNAVNFSAFACVNPRHITQLHHTHTHTHTCRQTDADAYMLPLLPPPKKSSKTTTCMHLAKTICVRYSQVRLL